MVEYPYAFQQLYTSMTKRQFPFCFSESAVRSKVCKLRLQHATVAQAEEAEGLNVDSYIDGFDVSLSSTVQHSALHSASFTENLHLLDSTQLTELITYILCHISSPDFLKALGSAVHTLSATSLIDCIQTVFTSLLVKGSECVTDIISMLDKLVCSLYKQQNFPAVKYPVSQHLKAMEELKKANKDSYLVHKFATCIGEKRPNSDDSLMPLNRMPFGLIQYQIQFFYSIRYFQNQGNGRFPSLARNNGM